MSWLGFNRSDRSDPRLTAAIARNIRAQERVGTAADAAGHAAEDNRESVEAAVHGLEQRTEQRRAIRAAAHDPLADLVQFMTRGERDR